jgi:hypothetical protein
MRCRCLIRYYALMTSVETAWLEWDAGETTLIEEKFCSIWWPNLSGPFRKYAEIEPASVSGQRQQLRRFQ